MTGPTAARQHELALRLDGVERRIVAACSAAGRDRSRVTLVAVTKNFPASDLVALSRLAVRHVGESRDQEAAEKLAELPADVRAALTVHFVGQLQSRKSGSVARYADAVHSLDRPKVVTTLGRAATTAGRVLDCLVQVDLDDDAGRVVDSGRGGVPPAVALTLADLVAEQDSLRLRGVMAVAPLGADPKRSFALLREVAAVIRAKHVEATWISAGMSGDLEAAVAQGATHLRVGTAILGSRPQPR